MAEKIWIGGNELIERNSREETYNELYKNGYPAKLSAFIKRREEALATDNKLRASKIKKSKVVEEEKEA